MYNNMDIGDRAHDRIDALCRTLENEFTDELKGKKLYKGNKSGKPTYLGTILSLKIDRVLEYGGIMVDVYTDQKVVRAYGDALWAEDIGKEWFITD